MTTSRADRRNETPPGRLVSLDVFRGATIAGMILVNNPGSWSDIFSPLRHAEWHGWTPTDLIFPFFLFIMGTALPFSFAGRRRKGATTGALLRHVAVRSALLFLLGMLLSGIPDYDFSHRLILDVLQRIGVVYLFSAPIVLLARPTVQLGTALFCTLLYWGLMAFVPVPGYGPGVLTPEGNLWQYVDSVLLAGWHFHGEGVLSLIPSLATVLFGALTGIWLAQERSTLEKVSGMFVAGNIGLAVGAIMDSWFPINKLLWSSSYVVFTAGFALNMLGVCLWLIEIKGRRRWTYPFLVFGMNAIASFFLSSLVSRIMSLIPIQGTTIKGWIYATLFLSWSSGPGASLLYALAYAFLWLGIMAILYRKRIFFKV